jgi:hypothetical protein
LYWVRAVDRPPGKAGNSMTKWYSRLAGLTGIAAAFMAMAAPAHAEKRVALVIGNNDYKNVPKLLPPETRSVSVELTYRDGSVSEIKSFRR